MKTNNEARTWCTENYNTIQERYYIYNAKKLILDEWRWSWRHALIVLVLVIGASVMGWINNPLLWLAALNISFAFYGIFNYCHNDQGSGGLAYICNLIFCLTALKEGHPVLKVLYIIVGLVLMGASVLTEINYRKNLGSYNQTTQRQWANDEEEFEAWKRKYYTGYSRSTAQDSATDKQQSDHSQNDYQQTQQAQRSTNKYADQARAMFADFGTTYAELKKTYRKLALKHHPDHGGEHDMFVAIVAEYEYLKSVHFPNEK